MCAAKDTSSKDLAAEVLAEARKRSLEHYLMEAPLVVGVSGGADSLVMLHLLVTLRGEHAARSLHVAHLNHWFRGKEAREDSDFVREIAERWGLSCSIETFDVPNYARRNKLSAEDAARRVRYAFLSQLAVEREAAVAVAHNADDQVETVLMSILRGTGISGLAGMQMLATVPPAGRDFELRAFGSAASNDPVVLFRPLLGVWRHRILEYCTQENLEPRFDTTNWERIYKRNRVRHDLLPLLQLQYSLAIKDHLYNLADIAQGEDELVAGVVDSVWKDIALESRDGALISFDTARFSKQPEAMRRRLARRAIEQVAGTLLDITFDHIQSTAAIIGDISGSPRVMQLPHSLVVERSGGQGRIWRGKQGQDAENDVWPLMELKHEIALKLPMDIALKNNWCLQAKLMQRGESAPVLHELETAFDAAAVEEMGQLCLRTRQPGDFIRPLGMDGHKSLQDLMVDAKIPRELRDAIPLIGIEGQSEVLWVPGRGGRRSSHAPITEQTQDWIQLQFRHPTISPNDGL